MWQQLGIQSWHEARRGRVSVWNLLTSCWIDELSKTGITVQKCKYVSNYKPIALTRTQRLPRLESCNYCCQIRPQKCGWHNILQVTYLCSRKWPLWRIHWTDLQTINPWSPPLLVLELIPRNLFNLTVHLSFYSFSFWGLWDSREESEEGGGEAAVKLTLNFDKLPLKKKRKIVVKRESSPVWLSPQLKKNHRSLSLGKTHPKLMWISLALLSAVLFQ